MTVHIPAQQPFTHTPYVHPSGPDGSACWTTEASYEAKKAAKEGEEKAARAVLTAEMDEEGVAGPPLPSDDVAATEEYNKAGGNNITVTATTTATAARAAASPASQRAGPGLSTPATTPSRKKQGLGQALQADRAYNTTSSANSLLSSASAGGLFSTVLGTVRGAVGGAVGGLVAQAEDGLGLEHGQLRDIAHATGADAVAGRAVGRAAAAVGASAEHAAAQALLRHSGLDVEHLLAAASAAGIEPAVVEALLLAAVQSDAFRGAAEALLAGDPGAAARAFSGPARQRVVQEVCEQTGLPEDNFLPPM